jgi:hypothetical protein
MTIRHPFMPCVGTGDTFCAEIGRGGRLRMAKALSVGGFADEAPALPLIHS